MYKENLTDKINPFCYPISETNNLYISEQKKFILYLNKDEDIRGIGTEYRFNNHIFHIPSFGIKIYQLLKSSEQILKLEDDWDERGSKKITKETWFSTVSFIIKYAEYIYTDLNIVIDLPKIYPSINGSIDLDWETNNYGILMNIADGGKFATFYADDKKNQKSEGEFNPLNFNINLLPKAINSL